MNKEVLCIQDLPLFMRDILFKQRTAFPVKGKFYTAILFDEFHGRQFYELAEFPPSNTFVGPMPHYWDVEMFIECEGMSEQIEEARAARTPKRIKCADLDLTGYNSTLYIP